MKKTIFMFIATLAVLSACNGQNKGNASANDEADAEVVKDTDSIICSALRNYILRQKADTAIMTPTAEQDLVESSWPEAQCSETSDLYCPGYDGGDVTVNKIGEGLYKYEATCPDHGDTYTDCCTMHASLDSDGEVRLNHVTWDE